MNSIVIIWITLNDRIAWDCFVIYFVVNAIAISKFTSDEFRFQWKYIWLLNEIIGHVNHLIFLMNFTSLIRFSHSHLINCSTITWNHICAARKSRFQFLYLHKFRAKYQTHTYTQKENWNKFIEECSTVVNVFFFSFSRRNKQFLVLFVFRH